MFLKSNRKLLRLIISCCVIIEIACGKSNLNHNNANQWLPSDLSTAMLSEGWSGPIGTEEFPRSAFGHNFGAMVYGWPKMGGYYVYYSSAAELEFFNLDRFKPAERSKDQDEEEAHCARMRQLGAKWFKDDEAERLFWGQNDQRDSPRLYVGWPQSGGVWALRLTKWESAKQGAGRIGNAFTMEERCELIKQLGGTFYEDPAECPHLDSKGRK